MKIKRCPFCGGEATVKETQLYNVKAVFVFCTQCKNRTIPVAVDATTMDGITLNLDQATEKVTSRWNRRFNDV